LSGKEAAGKQGDMTSTGTVPSPAGLVAALDIGGTKIAGALVDAEGRIRLRARRATPAAEDGGTVMAAVAEVLGELREAPLWGQVRAVGIGSAGPVDRAAGAVSPVNIPGWRGYPLRERVRERVGGLPVELIGDGAAVAAAEHWVGAARGSSDALCMVVSTGVGGGLVLDGRVRPGRTGNAGHIGHISVDVDGDGCPCGARGCVEGLARGPAIARRALEVEAEVIGINNRDLGNFTVDIERTYELLSDVPAGKTVVSESGFSTREQLDELDRVGVDAVLIGETLMRAPDIEAACRELTGDLGV
jgi:predicted NBD/HSP70 family sugar kinase